MGLAIDVIDFHGRFVRVGSLIQRFKLGRVPLVEQGREGAGRACASFLGARIQVDHHAHFRCRLGFGNHASAFLHVELDVRDGGPFRWGNDRGRVQDGFGGHAVALQDVAVGIAQVAFGIEAEIARPGVVLVGAAFGRDDEEALAADGDVGGGVGGFESAQGHVIVDGAYPDALADLVADGPCRHLLTHERVEDHARGLEAQRAHVGDVVGDDRHVFLLGHDSRGADIKRRGDAHECLRD